MSFIATTFLAIAADAPERGQFLGYKSLLMLIPLLSVFLGMLFAMRYHSISLVLDEALRDAGEPGLTPRQLRYLHVVRGTVIAAILTFCAALLLFLGAGIGTNAPRWPFIVACIAHTLMSLVLAAAAIADQRAGVTRPWLRSLVALLGLSGAVGAPLAAIYLSPDLMLA